VLNLESRTEIHEACANLSLAESLLRVGRSDEAEVALRDAAGHYERARSSVEQAEAIIPKLQLLRKKINQLRSFQTLSVRQ
jgi:hypothetical protein